MRARLREEIVVTMSVEEARAIVAIDLAALDAAGIDVVAPLIKVIDSVLGTPPPAEDDHSL